MTKLTPDKPCESCGGLLVPPQIASGVQHVREGTDYVCLKCGRPYRWFGNPPRLVVLHQTPASSDDEQP